MTLIVQVSDLCLDFETLKGEAELDDEAITEESERLERELASVQASLDRMRRDNSRLTQSIHEKSQDIQRAEVQIRSNADDIEKTKTQVSRMFLRKILSCSRCKIVFSSL